MNLPSRLAFHAGRQRTAAAMATLPPPRQGGHMLTAQQAADRLGVTVRQLNRYQAAGLITPVQKMSRGHRQFTEQSVNELHRTQST